MRRVLLAAVLGFGIAPAAQAHNPEAVPSDPELEARYRAALTAYLNRDYAAALKDWRPLAEQGSSAAQIFIAFMHANGLGLPQDAAAAADWYARAAARDDAIAQLRLAIQYRHGRGVARDAVTAHMWAQLAGRARSQAKNHMQPLATALRAALESDMTPDQVAEAERRAQAWLASHATAE